MVSMSICRQIVHPEANAKRANNIEFDDSLSALSLPPASTPSHFAIFFYYIKTMKINGFFAFRQLIRSAIIKTETNRNRNERNDEKQLNRAKRNGRARRNKQQRSETAKGERERERKVSVR